MMASISKRPDRYHGVKDDDHRDWAVRDRDRLMFSYCVQRLSGVSQVASAIDGSIFHNRLTHTLEMAQFGRRLTEKIVAECSEKQADIRDYLNPDVVEAACLAHDIGHPPFGHEGEDALDYCMSDSGKREGFEGNAQSFRIASKLEPYRPDFPGLNLSRATLTAITKYPNLWESGIRKYSWYHDDKEQALWMMGNDLMTGPSIEAQVMDISDDIAYAAHDLVDFTRAHVIPLFSIKVSDELRRELVNQFFKSSPKYANVLTLSALRSMMQNSVHVSAEYDGSTRHRSQLRLSSSMIIKHFRDRVSIERREDGSYSLAVDLETHAMLSFMKFLTSNYAHSNRQILAQRKGYNRIIRHLHDSIKDDLLCGRRAPIAFDLHESFDKLKHTVGDDSSAGRIAADFICTLTDAQALGLYRQIKGISPATFLASLDG